MSQPDGLSGWLSLWGAGGVGIEEGARFGGRVARSSAARPRHATYAGEAHQEGVALICVQIQGLVIGCHIDMHLHSTSGWTCG